MALWPFGRKKRKAHRADEKNNEKEDDDLGITTQITGPEGSSKSLRKSRSSKPTSKPSSRKVSKTRDLDTSNLPPPPPVPTISQTQLQQQQLQQPSKPPTTDILTNEKASQSQQALDNAQRPPLAEVENVEALPQPPYATEYKSGSQTSLQPENFTVLREAPTLRARRSIPTEPVRRKSSKRKADAKAREKEIKSMSSPIPIPKRPRSYTSGPLARDSKIVPGGLNKSLSRPASQVSLPLAESLRSSISGPFDMHQNSFRVSAFDALAPRPTIRYSENPRMSSPHGTSRTSHRKDKGPIIPEEDFGPKARIDNLADDMDASGLRELMERDRRRRERKKKSDRDKLERKLQRRLEKQKAALIDEPGPSGDTTMHDAQDFAPSSKNALSSDQPKETTASPDDRTAPKSPESWLQDPSREHLTDLEDPFLHDPMSQSRLDLATDDERDEPVLQTAQAVRLSAASLSPPSSPVTQHGRGPSTLSNMTPASQTQLADIPEPHQHELLSPEEGRRDSETSARAGTSWKSLFRRGGTNVRRGSTEKGRNTPSEFSNTSRESFARQNKQPPPVVQRSFAPKDGVPKRTRSKFREDLPELPISPPPTRFQSSDTPQSPQSPTSPTSPYIDHTSKVDTMDEQARVSTPLGDVHPAFRDEIALSRGPSMRADTPEGASAALLSQSLASVDSEGSWLSGRPQKRSSIPINSVRESGGSFSEQIREGNEEPSEVSFDRRTTSPGKAPARSGLISQFRREQSGYTGAEDDDEEYNRNFPTTSPSEEPKYAAVHEGKARLVQGASAFKSREGLLDMFNAGEESQDVSPVSPVSSESAATPTETSPEKGFGRSVSVHRATSVDYGKGHTRKVSAGSARLLDIPARSSTEMKRSSVASSTKGSPLLQQEALRDEDDEGEGEGEKAQESSKSTN